MRVMLCGGPSRLERQTGDAHRARSVQVPMVNQIGRDTLPQMLALLARATVLLSPDSGPVHMATMVRHPGHRPVRRHALQRVGPYCRGSGASTATTRLRAASAAAAPRQLPWHRKIEQPGVMDLIEVPMCANGSMRCWLACLACLLG